MGPIEESIVITAAEVQQWFGLAAPPSITIGIYAMLLTTAKQLADQFCNNEFLDEDDEVSIPEAVKVGVLQLLSGLVSSWKKSAGVTTNSGIVTKEKAGDVEVQYQATSGTVAAELLTAGSFAYDALAPYRMMPL